MKRSKFYLLLSALLAVLSLGACKESEEASSEYDNWQERNEAYFLSFYNQAQEAISRGSDEWKIFTSWSLNDSIATLPENHIVVRVLEKGTGSGCPMFTDSVRVHYRGWYMPTVTYPEGQVIAESYNGNYNPGTMYPAQQYVGGVIYASALMNMHIGDRWRIYIPYQLAYGANDYTAKIGSSSVWVRGSSCLTYDVTLVAYYRPGADIPDWKARIHDTFVDEEGQIP